MIGYGYIDILPHLKEGVLTSPPSSSRCMSMRVRSRKQLPATLVDVDSLVGELSTLDPVEDSEPDNNYFHEGCAR